MKAIVASLVSSFVLSGCGSLPIASMATSAMGMLSGGSDKGGIEVVHIDNSKTTKITNTYYRCRCKPNCTK